MLEPSCLTQHTCWCVKSVLSEDQMLIEQRIWDGMPLLAIRSSHSKMPMQNAKNATFVDNTHVVAALIMSLICMLCMGRMGRM